MPHTIVCPTRRTLILDFVTNLILVFLPLPIGFLSKKLAGRNGDNGDMEFYSHPNFVCVCHLIWVGWLVAAAGSLQQELTAHGWPTLPIVWLNRLWVIVLIATLLVLGLKFDRVACGFLVAAILILILVVTVAEFKIQTPVAASFLEIVSRIPIQLSWGVPMLTSLALGIVFAAVVTWQSVNDRWILPRRGNYIEHVNFQQRDRSISKGAKSFVARFDCLIRRYLCFGYGDIEVRSANGNAVLDRIEGVFFAARHAERMKRRLSITDVAVALDEIEEEEDLPPAD